MREDVFDKSDAFRYQKTFREMEALRRSIKIGDTVSIRPHDGPEQMIEVEYVGHDYIKGKSFFGYPDTISIFNLWKYQHTISAGKAAPDDSKQRTRVGAARIGRQSITEYNCEHNAKNLM